MDDRWDVHISNPSVNWLESAIASGLVQKLADDRIEVEEYNIYKFLNHLRSNEVKVVSVDPSDHLIQIPVGPPRTIDCPYCKGSGKIDV